MVGDPCPLSEQCLAWIWCFLDQDSGASDTHTVIDLHLLQGPPWIREQRASDVAGNRTLAPGEASAALPQRPNRTGRSVACRDARGPERRLSHLKTRPAPQLCSLVPATPGGSKPDSRVPFLGGNPARVLRDTCSRTQLEEEGGKGSWGGASGLGAFPLA